ncbi:MAG TPA: LCP family protein [Acidimicrobiia bacterium]|nr:LCP family protein [Acidimicrobiia bacterium]
MIDLNPRPPSHRPGLAALLSAVLPGAGHWWLGWRRRALLLAVPALAVLGVLVFLARDGAAALAEKLVQPAWLWGLIGLNAAVALLRFGAVADAWRLERPRGMGWGRSALRLAPAIVVAAAITVPQVFVHRYAVDALDLLETVFVEPDEVPPLSQRIADLLAQGLSIEDLGPDLGTTSTTSASTTTLPPTTTTSSAAVSTSTAAPTTTSTLPPGEVLAGEIGGNRVTVLLAGGDFGPGRADLRTDVMIVAVLDLEAGKAALISVSRDLVQAPLPAAWSRFNTMVQVQQWHEERAYRDAVAEAEAAGEDLPEQSPFEPCDCYFDRLNYLHVHTANWVQTFPESPDPGMEALREVVSVLLGIPIDHYVLVDFAGFVDLVEAVGGIDVNATEEMHIAFSPAKEGEEPIEIDIAPGPHHLDGRTALAYVRNRTGSSDSQRMLRQRCLLRDLGAELDAGTLLTSFTPIARAITASTTSTIPLDLLPHLIRVVAQLDTGDIVTAAIGYPAHSRGLNYMNLPIVDAGAARATVAGLLAGLAEGTTAGDGAGECG